VVNTARFEMWQGQSMKHLSPMRRAIGIVLIMIGLTWLALGSGFLGGSVMSGQVIWAVVGVAVAISGGYVLYRGIPRR
jgi:4-hydroxybenzoate polyprenyltransferase